MSEFANLARDSRAVFPEKTARWYRGGLAGASGQGNLVDPGGGSVAAASTTDAARGANREPAWAVVRI